MMMIAHEFEFYFWASSSNAGLSHLHAHNDHHSSALHCDQPTRSVHASSGSCRNGDRALHCDLELERPVRVLKEVGAIAIQQRTSEHDAVLGLTGSEIADGVFGSKTSCVHSSNRAPVPRFAAPAGRASLTS